MNAFSSPHKKSIRSIVRTRLYDKSLSRIDTPQGTLSLFSIFLPLLVESLLTNSMGTVNTLILSQYSDDAVAAVGTANQLLGMIYTFYTVISTGASIFISHRLGAKKRNQASDAAFTAILCSFVLSLLVISASVSPSPFFRR